MKMSLRWITGERRREIRVSETEDGRWEGERGEDDLGKMLMRAL